jgi:phosphate transport system permease protein
MTDTAVDTARPRSIGELMSTPEASRRVKARYRAEARYKAYGWFAIVLTGAFLLYLLVDLVRNAVPAFTHHSLVLDVAVPADLVPAESRNDPRAIRGADYFPATRDALKAVIPGVESRQNERILTRLLSTGAADELAARLVANPGLIGTTVKVPLRLSDDADLYLKGMESDVKARAGRGTATPSGRSGEVTVLSSSNDFAEVLVEIKNVAAARLSQITAERRRIAVFGGAGVQQRLKEIDEEAADLRRRIDAPAVEETLTSRLPSQMIEINGGLIKVTQLGNSRIVGDVVIPLASDAEAKPGSWRIVEYTRPEANRKASDVEIAFLERFKAEGKVENAFNWRFFTAGDSREPELAGMLGSIVGSALTMLVTLVLCLPIGVLAAIYLEEFAPKNKITDLIEVNINNLAAVPSIVFGLLGLAVFLNFFGMPRSAPVVGGCVIALMSLPTIIIAARAAIRAVPPSIREAALGVGASHQQAVFHHVLPLAIPGIMTGTIISMAHALGETAPLLMIGMVAFIVDVPQSFTQAATVIPVQIYLWADLPELAFRYKAAGAIIVLLVFLFIMNGLAIWLRRKFERRW